MLTVQEKTVDLTNYSPEDSFIKKADGGTLYIQVEGEASVSLKMEANGTGKMHWKVMGD
mgnify:CR=1 FL=1